MARRHGGDAPRDDYTAAVVKSSMGALVSTDDQALNR
jgi:hypothetical protein